MRIFRTILILVLTLTTGSFFTSDTSPAHAVLQSGVSRWAPYGPNMNNMIVTFYSDFQSMFNAFTTGQLDITDWPIQPSDLSSFRNNPDFFVSSPTSDFGIFQLDINHHNNFLGISQQSSRTVSPASIVSTTTSAGCSTGFGQLNVILQNQETGNSLILDPLNQVKAVQTSGSPSVSTFDSGGATPRGVYKLPCTLAGTYTISTTVYSGTATTSIGSAQNVTVTFRVNWNSLSTVNPSQAGIEIGRGLAHLIDKPSFLSIGALAGQASYNDIQAPPSQGLSVAGAPFSQLPQSVLNEDCAEHTWFTPCAPVSAYNFVADILGGGSEWWTASGTTAGASAGYSGSIDIRAACDDFVSAGFTITPAGKTCSDVANASISTIAPSSYAHLVPSGNIGLYIRTNAPRKAFGQIVADSLNFLFGTPNNGGTVCYGPCPNPTPIYYTISQVASVIFGDGSNPNGWNLYTGGFVLSATPDHLYSIYDSQFSGGICAGPTQQFPSDYPFYCNPQYDTEAAAGEFGSSLSNSNQFFSNAALIAHRTVMTIPVYSAINQFVGLNGWNYQQCGGISCTNTGASLVSVLGHGFQIGYQSLLNMRTVPGYVPANSIYSPSGGISGLIRRGFSQDTDNLSPFQATTLWDFEVISQVYDSMLNLNPATGGSNAQLIDWMTTSHSISFNPNEVSCIGATCVTGTTTQLWHLRNDLFFHDGTPVTANDVAYSIIAYRDIPSANLGPSVANVASAAGLDCGTGQPCKTVQVKVQNQSPFYELNIGSLPIIPMHVWAPICGNPPNPASQCGSPTFDPMASGILIGSGPWVCKNINTGVPGGSCSQNADGSLGTQFIGAGGKILLQANTNYMRGPANLQGSNLQKLSWADANDDGVVNILDLASAAVHFGQADSYWVNPVVAPGSIVNIQDLATVAFYFGHGLTSPFPPSQLVALDPQLDPFRIDLTLSAGPIMYYEGGPVTSGQLSVKLVSLSGTPNASSFTAKLATLTGTIVGTATGTPGSSSSIVQLSFSGIASGTRYQLSITFAGGSRPMYTIQIQA
jgi:hypothetical protein